LTEAQREVLETLTGVLDPELGINIVDLGLVYRVDVENSHVRITMTMTTPGCPAHQTLTDEVEAAVKEIPWITDVMVRVVWSPPWTPERLSPRARAQLGKR
jgi:metal-sulfur cluster biosynthetic enzyme